MVQQIRKAVEQKLQKDHVRLEHTLNVYRTATKLARHHKKPSLPIQIAALFHDYTKNDTLEEQNPYLTTYELKKYHQTPAIFHALSAAKILKKEFGINQTNILNAIKKHVWGDEKMNYCDKIVLLSDKIEPGREYPQKDYFIKLAYLNLNKAVFEILQNNFAYYNKKGYFLPSNYKDILNALEKKVIRKKHHD